MPKATCPIAGASASRSTQAAGGEQRCLALGQEPRRWNRRGIHLSATPSTKGVLPYDRGCRAGSLCDDELVDICQRRERRVGRQHDEQITAQ